MIGHRLNNTYNYLPPSSSLRSTTLLSLLSLLSLANDLSALPLTTTYLTSSLSEYSIPQSEKISFLTSASTIYQNAGDLSKALELQLLAIKLSEGSDAELAEKAVILQVADSRRFEFEVIDGVSGKVGELQALFGEVDEIEAIEKGKQWVEANGSVIENAGRCDVGMGVKSELMGCVRYRWIYIRGDSEED
jgi:translation initiation factor 3 subunit M